MSCSNMHSYASQGFASIVAAVLYKQCQALSPGSAEAGNIIAGDNSGTVMPVTPGASRPNSLQLPALNCSRQSQL